MSFQNPYIQQAQDEPNILCEPEEYQSKKWKWSETFKNSAPIFLEIGTGLGNFFSQEANSRPEINFVGIEIKYKRLVKTLQKTHKLGRDDVYLVQEYAEKITDIFEKDELSQVYIYFPDPWPKKKHHKNRLIQPKFLTDLCHVLQQNGRLLFKTDDRPYFDWVVEHITTHPGLEITKLEENYEADKRASPHNSTEFEVIWRKQGKPVMYLEVQKT